MIKVTEAHCVTKEYTPEMYTCKLLGDIESKLTLLEKCNINTFGEWDAYLEELTARLLKINQGVKHDILQKA